MLPLLSMGQWAEGGVEMAPLGDKPLSRPPVSYPPLGVAAGRGDELGTLEAKPQIYHLE